MDRAEIKQLAEGRPFQAEAVAHSLSMAASAYRRAEASRIRWIVQCAEHGWSVRLIARIAGMHPTSIQRILTRHRREQ